MVHWCGGGFVFRSPMTLLRCVWTLPFGSADILNLYFFCLFKKLYRNEILFNTLPEYWKHEPTVLSTFSTYLLCSRILLPLDTRGGAVFSNWPSYVFWTQVGGTRWTCWTYSVARSLNSRPFEQVSSDLNPLQVITCSCE